MDKLYWSRTRRKMFTQCPRKWYLTYGNLDQNKKKNSHRLRESPWNLMLRAMKTTLLDRLEDVRDGKQWSSQLVHYQLDQAIVQNFERRNQPLDATLRKSLNLYAQHRFTCLWRCSTVQQLLNHTYKQWYVFDRTDAEHIEGITAYCAPDLAIRIQNKWLLVRFDMQGERKTGSSELEANAMVLWSRQRQGLPDSSQKYVLRTIGWRRGFWEVHTYKPNLSSVMASLQLLLHDAKAMLELQRRSMKNLVFAPLANDQRACGNCSFAAKCPGSNNLKEARVQQRLLELAHSRH
ncbi:MAG: hypothetical protein CMA63_04880 [Euryarchaeota archaeon]|nr:hypothetical protein [Euryarchaeota archaeon]